MKNDGALLRLLSVGAACGLIDLTKPNVHQSEAGQASGWRLLNNAGCRELRGQLHAFETQALGGSFGSSSDDFQSWLSSENLFYAALADPAAPAAGILSVLSILVADGESCEALLRGRLQEHELEPWDPAVSESEPVLYLSTVVCPSSGLLPMLYDTLLRDLKEYLAAREIDVHAGLSIACTPAGSRHLERNGFVRIAGRKYQDRHDFMAIDRQSARSVFWKSLLSPRSAPIRQGWGDPPVREIA